MLSIQLFLSTVLETGCSRIPKVQEENVVEHHHAWTMNASYSADSHLVAALERRFLASRGEQPQLDIVEKSRVPEVCLVQCLHGNSRRIFWAFSLTVSRPLLRKSISEDLMLFLVLFRIFAFCRFGLRFVLHPAYDVCFTDTNAVSDAL